MIRNLAEHVKGKQLLVIAVLVMAALLPYLNILSNDFVFDDFDFFIRWEGVKHLYNIPSFFAGELPTYHQHVYRPIRSVLQAVVYQFSHGNPLGFHIFSLIVQVSGTLVFYAFARKLLVLAAAITASIIFAVLPVHTNTITFITASFDTAGAVLGLLSVYLYINYTRRSDKRIFIASVVCAIIAYFTYEMMLTIPFLIALYDQCFGEKRKLTAGRVKTYLPYLTGAVALIVVRVLIIGGNFSGGLIEPIPFIARMLTMLKGLVFYLHLTVVGYPLSIVHDITVSSSIGDLTVLASAAIIFGLLYLARLAYRAGRPIYTFSILWFFIALLPVLNVIQLAAFVRENYLYTATVGWALAAGYLLHIFFEWGKRRRMAIFPLLLGTITIIAYGYLTFQRNFDYKNDVALYSAALKLDPRYAGGYNGIAFHYRKEKNYKLATEYAKKAIEVSPRYYVSYALLGEIHMEQGLFEEAIGYFNQTLEINNSYVSAYLNRGVSNFNLKKFEEAEADYIKAIELYPDYYLAHKNLGIVSMVLNKFDAAVVHLEKAAERFHDAQIYFGLGISLANTGRVREGEQYLMKALELDQNLEPARKALEELRNGGQPNN